MAEFELIDLIRARCALKRDDVLLGIGDDAALLASPLGQALVVSTDTLIAGVHFPQSTKVYDIGWKALAVNLSDLAAMGATPAWATLALTLPAADAKWVSDFADGFAALAHEFGLALVGGDTTQGPLSITVTIFGFVPEQAALRRDGAQVGDAVCVTGTLGDSAAGLQLLRGSESYAQTNPNDEFSVTQTQLLARLNRPTPRIAQGVLLRGRAHACIDVSDGLVADLGHICAASAVSAEIDLSSLPTSPALLALFDATQRTDFQLAGGDDYELCFTVAETEVAALLDDLARSGYAATRIGRIVAVADSDNGKGSDVRVRDAAGNLYTSVHRGWQHFAT